MSNTFIDVSRINQNLSRTSDVSPSTVLDILETAKKAKGLDMESTLILLQVEDPELQEAMFEAADYVKNLIYGKRLVLFAPLYISNYCKNDCAYCAFRASNSDIARRFLTQAEIRLETEALLRQGHKRILLVAGEAYPPGKDLDYVLESIDTIYSTWVDGANIRRINVNIAPLSVEDFRRLHDAQIGTYQIFQETYHPDTYKKVHLSGPKADYEWRLYAMDRAFEAGFDDVGIGVLFGLHDFRFEVAAMLQHIQHLEKTFGLGPHTISVPRLEPAHGAEIAMDPPAPVTDHQFKRIIATLRLAVPYTGIILSTRETPQMRREAFRMGVSQISAGSRTNPGGYGEEENAEEQFSLGDHRPMEEVIVDVMKLGFIPSFCTACYRLGRVGKDFMDLAKPGLIQAYCLPNAMTSFAEYLEDYAKPETREMGYEMIDSMMDDLPGEKVRQHVAEALEKVRDGHRDVYL